MRQLIQPKGMRSVLCPKCKELLVKIYPWSPIDVPPLPANFICNKCVNENIKKQKVKAL